MDRAFPKRSLSVIGLALAAIVSLPALLASASASTDSGGFTVRAVNAESPEIFGEAGMDLSLSDSGGSDSGTRTIYCEDRAVQLTPELLKLSQANIDLYNDYMNGGPEPTDLYTATTDGTIMLIDNVAGFPYMNITAATPATAIQFVSKTIEGVNFGGCTEKPDLPTTDPGSTVPTLVCADYNLQFDEAFSVHAANNLSLLMEARASGLQEDYMKMALISGGANDGWAIAVQIDPASSELMGVANEFTPPEQVLAYRIAQAGDPGVVGEMVALECGTTGNGEV